MNAPRVIRSQLSDRQRRALLAALVATGNARQDDGSAEWEPLSDRCLAVEAAVVTLDECRTAGARIAALAALAETLGSTVDLPDETAECVAALLAVTPDQVPA